MEEMLELEIPVMDMPNENQPGETKKQKCERLHHGEVGTCDEDGNFTPAV